LVSRYWKSLSDDELLNTELETDDPENCQGLVREFPEGDEETYMQYKYDLRGSGREKEFVCVHGNHQHLAGYVMRKGDNSFLVGWMCGKSIHGLDFEQIKSDFDAAVNRRDTLQRKREISISTGPFQIWLEEFMKSEVFDKYQRVRKQLQQHLPWVWENVPRANFIDCRLINNVTIPVAFFQKDTDPKADITNIMLEVAGATMRLGENSDLKEIRLMKRKLESAVDRLERSVSLLNEVVDFFQPALLSAVCKLANKYDNPKKRVYSFQLGKLCCKREGKEVIIPIPKNYSLPNMAGFNRFRDALNGISERAAA